MASKFLKSFVPLFDRVLVQRFEAEVTTKGGIMIPEKAKVCQHGKTVPLCVKVGDKVYLPEYGGTKVVFEDQEYFLFRESDILGKFSK
ncbi:10 kda heat shock protein [Sparganum proliferum]